MARHTKRKKSISLWSVIESMQRKLEGEGLDAEVVDAAVTRGLEALLRTHDAKRPNGSAPEKKKNGVRAPLLPAFVFES